jgi:hypothetical protein
MGYIECSKRLVDDCAHQIFVMGHVGATRSLSKLSGSCKRELDVCTVCQTTVCDFLGDEIIAQPNPYLKESSM